MNWNSGGKKTNSARPCKFNRGKNHRGDCGKKSKNTHNGKETTSRKNNTEIFSKRCFSVSCGQNYTQFSIWFFEFPGNLDAHQSEIQWEIGLYKTCCLSKTRWKNDNAVGLDIAGNTHRRIKTRASISIERSSSLNQFKMIFCDDGQIFITFAFPSLRPHKMSHMQHMDVHILLEIGWRCGAAIFPFRNPLNTGIWRIDCVKYMQMYWYDEDYDFYERKHRHRFSGA